MTTEVLLVFGPRVLAANPAAVAWARERIARRIETLPAGSTVLTGGCADSPDEWAGDCVLETRPDLRLCEFRLDGREWHGRAPAERDWLRHAPPGSEECRGTPKWPLRRNDAMERALRHAKGRGATASFLGFIAAWSKSGGSRYMLERLVSHPGTTCHASLTFATPEQAAAVRERAAKEFRRKDGGDGAG